MRFATFCVATALAALPAYAASPKVEFATEAFQSVAADPAKVKTYCEMSKVMEGAGDQANAATEKKIRVSSSSSGQTSRQRGTSVASSTRTHQTQPPTTQLLMTFLQVQLAMVRCL